MSLADDWVARVDALSDEAADAGRRDLGGVLQVVCACANRNEAAERELFVAALQVMGKLALTIKDNEARQN